MRASSFFCKLFLGMLFLPAFIISTELTNLEDEAEGNDIHFQHDLEMSAIHHCSDSSHHGSKTNDNQTVFASYRNNGNQINIPAGGNVLFNVRNANKGNGIHYNSESGVFTIQKPGFYLVNYGIASIGNAGEVTLAFGFNLIRHRKGHHALVDSVLANGSSAIVLFLQAGDTLAIVSQERVTLIAGSLPPKTTTLTDTSFISFLRVNR